ncbi:MAG: histidine kinase [Bacteroidetes bacterium]|nr:histidine kinase [Bacteroidota bacterium]
MRSTYLLRVIALLILSGTFFSLQAQTACLCAEFTLDVRKRFDENKVALNYEAANAIADEFKKSEISCCQAIGFALEASVANARALTEESRLSALSALRILKEEYHPYASAECNRILGVYYNRQGNPDSSIYFYYKALDLIKFVDDPTQQSMVYTGISSVFMNQKQYEKGIYFTKKALTVALGTTKTSLLAQAYSNLAIAYFYSYDTIASKKPFLDSAYTTALESMKYARKAGVPVNIIKNYVTLGDVATKRLNFKEALLYSDTLLTYITPKTNANVRSAIFSLRAAAFVGLNEHQKSIEWLQKGLEQAMIVNNIFSVREIKYKLYEAYKASGSTALALQSLEQYKVLSDSLVTKENAEAISEMEQKYNKVENELTIQELAAQKQFYLLLSVAGLLAIIAFAFFLRQLSLRHKKTVLEAEQRLNRARMNPHFFFNALTSLQQHALQQKDGLMLASRLSQFSDVMRKTLESTYQEYTTIEEEMEFLRQYLEIQKNRYPIAFDFSIEAQAEVEIDELLIPPMIIQPFVENSIEHGMAGIDWKGHISIRFEKRADELYVEVLDNGKGLQAEKVEKNEHISRASEIIKDRIYLLATKVKSKARFTIGQPTSGTGVLVAIYLPLLYKNMNIRKNA